MGLFDIFKKGSATQDEVVQTSDETSAKDSLDLVQISEGILLDTRTNINELETIKIPLGELATLGGAVAAMLPGLRTVTQNATINTNGLYRVINAADGVLKANKTNQFFWGALKKADGGSAMAKLVEAGPLNASSTTLMPIDPATMMMAAALYSIEKQLDTIVELEKQIYSFLEEDKEAKIEGDLKTLTGIIQNYKNNWNDEMYRSSHYQLVLEKHSTAEQNLIFYQKQVDDIVKEGTILVAGKKIKSTNAQMQKAMKYYRLSLYIYALSSFLELMLLGNFSEENISFMKNNLSERSKDYELCYDKCAEHLGKMAKNSIGKNAVNGIGAAGKAVGNLIGSIPVVKNGPVDEWLIEKGSGLKESAADMEQSTVALLDGLKESGAGLFISRFEDMEKIYAANAIYFDKDNVYLSIA